MVKPKAIDSANWLQTMFKNSLVAKQDAPALSMASNIMISKELISSTCTTEVVGILLVNKYLMYLRLYSGPQTALLGLNSLGSDVNKL